eukprot:11588674-Alexandrium_andersonii.AAC.1
MSASLVGSEMCIRDRLPLRPSSTIPWTSRAGSSCARIRITSAPSAPASPTDGAAICQRAPSGRACGGHDVRRA